MEHYSKRLLKKIKKERDVKMTPKEIIEQAQVVVSGARQTDYGHPRDNHNCTATMWSAWLSRRYDMPIQLDNQDVCMMNVLQKVSREANKHKDDTWVDIVGYVLNAAMCKDSDVVKDCPSCHSYNNFSEYLERCMICRDFNNWEPK